MGWRKCPSVPGVSSLDQVYFKKTALMEAEWVNVAEKYCSAKLQCDTHAPKSIISFIYKE